MRRGPPGNRPPLIASRRRESVRSRPSCTDSPRQPPRPLDTPSEPVMYNRLLRRMRELVRPRQYIMPSHAEEEMEADGLTIYDVESTILTGTIVERQKDRVSGEWKYLVSGQSLDGEAVTVVVKFSFTGKLVFITVFSE